MTIEKLTRDNFALSSLDGFVRTQPVTEVYRKFGGEYQLVNEPFTDDWSPRASAKRPRKFRPARTPSTARGSTAGWPGSSCSRTH